MELNLEDSTTQARILKQIQALVMDLDAEYLTVAYEEMKSNLSWRDAAMILNPNPFTHSEQQQLDQAKVKQLGLFLELRKNLDVIAEKENNLSVSKIRSNKLEDLFR